MKPTETCQISINNKVSKNVTLFLRGSIQSFEDYSELFDLLPTLTENDTLSIILSSPGGDCEVGFAIIDHILGCAAPVSIEVIYPTYSMGAIIALCGDELILNADSYLMFHDYSGGMRGKGEETYQYTTNYRKAFKSRFKRICMPFLTEEECNNMFKGEDIYVTASTIKARSKRHFK